jgi:hypothetical protein
VMSSDGLSGSRDTSCGYIDLDKALTGILLNPSIGGRVLVP